MPAQINFFIILNILTGPEEPAVPEFAQQHPAYIFFCLRNDFWCLKVPYNTVGCIYERPAKIYHFIVLDATIFRKFLIRRTVPSHNFGSTIIVTFHSSSEI